MNRLLMTITTAFALGACAGTNVRDPALDRVSAVQPGTARIVVYRPDTFVGAMQHLRIWANGEKVAALWNSDMTFLDVMPGQHVIESDFGGLTYGKAETLVDAEPGKVYFVEAKAGTMRQLVVDGSFLTGKLGDGPPPQGGARVQTYADMGAGFDHLSGYKYVAAYTTTPLRSPTGTSVSGWRR